MYPLIRPFIFQSVIVPILAEKINNLLDAPVPFVAGCVSLPSEVPSDVVILDISKNQILTNNPLPVFPKMPELKKKCGTYLRELEESFKSEVPYRTSKEQLTLVQSISTMFETHLESLFSNFNNYTICNMNDPTTPISAFMKESFLEDLTEENEVSFYEPFFATQLFMQYSDKRLRKQDLKNRS